MPEADAERTLILGCGYLGRILLATMASGALVAVSRAPARAALIAAAGAAVWVDDVTQAAGRERLARTLRGRLECALVLLPPTAYGSAPGAMAAILGNWLRELGVTRAVLASSTAVYGERNGADVDATTPIVADSPRAQRLLDIEQAWRATAPAARLLRLAGLYGPGRIVGARSVRAGDLLPGNGEAWLNLVRAEDAARALAACVMLEQAPAVGLISDGTPVRRTDYYTWLASALGAPPVRFAGGDRGTASRRCDPTATWSALALRPLYATYRAGLIDLLQAPGAPPHSRMN